MTRRGAVSARDDVVDYRMLDATFLHRAIAPDPGRVLPTPFTSSSSRTRETCKKR